MLSKDIRYSLENLPGAIETHGERVKELRDSVLSVQLPDDDDDNKDDVTDILMLILVLCE